MNKDNISDLNILKDNIYNIWLNYYSEKEINCLMHYINNSIFIIIWLRRNKEKYNFLIKERLKVLKTIEKIFIYSYSKCKDKPTKKSKSFIKEINFKYQNKKYDSLIDLKEALEQTNY